MTKNIILHGILVISIIILSSALIAIAKEKLNKIDGQSNMANPASVNCINQGGKLVIKKDKKSNEYGVCIFSDGSQCEEWKFFRGECKKGK